MTIDLCRICPDSPTALTSAGVDLQLAVDVALIHQRVQHVKHTVYVPDLWVVPQEVDLLLRLLGCFAAVLAERLELEREGAIISFFYYRALIIPYKQPLICQRWINYILRTGLDLGKNIHLICIQTSLLSARVHGLFSSQKRTRQRV